MTAEFDLIDRIRTRAATTRADVVLGIGDDAAVLRVSADHDLVVSTDTLNCGVHFPTDTTAFDIGWKSLAVNLSDLAAMGAQPAWCTLNLTMPDADDEWLDAFLDGFLALSREHAIALVGGDTTRGPLSITVTVHGLVPHGTALLRSGAQVGDDVWVSGTLGDAAAALEIRDVNDVTAAFVVGIDPCSQQEHNGYLRSRLDRPTPRVALGLALRGVATACIDVSDGLLADLGHVTHASNAGAEISISDLPTSVELAQQLDHSRRVVLQVSGGDDYELCFTAAPAHALRVVAAGAQAGVGVTRIGRIEREPGLRVRNDDGVVTTVVPSGYRHFDPGQTDT